MEERLQTRKMDKELDKSAEAAAQATLDGMIAVWQAYQICC